MGPTCGVMLQVNQPHSNTTKFVCVCVCAKTMKLKTLGSRVAVFKTHGDFNRPESRKVDVALVGGSPLLLAHGDRRK